jgi:hypothetical protein
MAGNRPQSAEAIVRDKYPHARLLVAEKDAREFRLNIE